MNVEYRLHLFGLFLEDRGVLDEYQEALIDTRAKKVDMTPTDFLEHWARYSPQGLIIKAFSWHEHNRGIKGDINWAEIHRDWVKTYTRINKMYLKQFKHQEQ